MNSELLLAQVYRRTAGSFLFLTIILLFLVAYIVLPKALVVVTPEIVTFEENIFFTVGATDEFDIDGLPIIVAIVLEQTFPGTGEKSVPENISGVATIFNEYSRSQPLVRTTRLLTADGVLFRLDESVTVPAGGSVDVPVYLDEDSELIGLLPHGTLTIPGLWEGLQDKIYGKIASPLGGEVVSRTIIQTDDITFGQNSLRAKAESEARKELVSVIENQQEFTKERIVDWELHAIEFVDEEWSVANELAGSFADTFILTGTVTFRGIFYSQNDADTAIEKHLKSQGVNRNIVINDRSFIITETELTDAVEVMATIEGSEKSIQKDTILKNNPISDLTILQAIAQLTKDPSVKDVKIELSPFWVKKIPKNKIDIVILKD